MERILIKKGAGIFLSFPNRHWVNSLSWTNLTMNDSTECISLSIDLSCNFRVRNKAINNYLDIQELAKIGGELQRVQIDVGSEIIDRLPNVHSRAPAAYWELILFLGEEKYFKYVVTPTNGGNSLYLDVERTMSQ